MHACAQACGRLCVRLGVCVPVCAHAPPHAAGGATLKDGADLPLCSLRCQWTSPHLPSDLQPPRRPSLLAKPPLPMEHLSPRGPGAGHRESISAWRRCSGRVQEAPFLGQQASPRGAKPRDGDPLCGHQCPAGWALAQSRSHVGVTLPDPTRRSHGPISTPGLSPASGFKNPRFGPNLQLGLRKSCWPQFPGLALDRMTSGAAQSMGLCPTPILFLHPPWRGGPAPGPPEVT